jgi:class 3 adenylate cyclase
MDCPNCRKNNPDGAKFCMNCATPLTALQTAAGASAGFLDQYLPQELFEKLRGARGRQDMVGERRVITMLFCDVRGSTAAAESTDPELWADIMAGAFERMIAPICKYEGFVPRLMGDAILAFFGGPIAHEDDPRRAIVGAMASSLAEPAVRDAFLTQAPVQSLEPHGRTAT